MKTIVSINNIKPGMVLLNEKDKRFVVVETDLNGDDNYYSRLLIVSESEFLAGNRVAISKDELISGVWSAKWIEAYEYNKYYSCCMEKYEITIKTIYTFNSLTKQLLTDEDFQKDEYF